jgi:iron complex transport system substrate-binding protein
MRNIGTGALEEVYAAGGMTYFNEILTLAGAINVLQGGSAAYPLLSAEGIIHLNPDYIFDIITGMDLKGFSIEQIQKGWQHLPDVSAVRNHRIVTLRADYTVIPGPRFILLLEDIARTIHPDIDWDKQ